MTAPFGEDMPKRPGDLVPDDAVLVAWVRHNDEGHEVVVAAALEGVCDSAIHVLTSACVGLSKGDAPITPGREN